jgi:hypothetical protein
MSSETSSTEPADPTAPAPVSKSGPVKPDNQYNDLLAPDLQAESLGGTAAQTPKKNTKAGGIQPANQYNDSAPKG